MSYIWLKFIWRSFQVYWGAFEEQICNFPLELSISPWPFPNQRISFKSLTPWSQQPGLESSVPLRSCVTLRTLAALIYFIRKWAQTPSSAESWCEDKGGEHRGPQWPSSPMSVSALVSPKFTVCVADGKRSILCGHAHALSLVPWF